MSLAPLVCAPVLIRRVRDGSNIYDGAVFLSSVTPATVDAARATLAIEGNVLYEDFYADAQIVIGFCTNLEAL